MDERGEILLEQVVAEVHHEVVVAEELIGDEDAVGEPEGRVLRDECERRAEALTLAQRGDDLCLGITDDHADLGDAGRDHRFDPVEQDRLVGHRNELLRTGVRDRAQPGAGTPGENESLHVSRIVWRFAQPFAAGGGPWPRKYANTESAPSPGSSTALPPIVLPTTGSE